MAFVNLKTLCTLVLLPLLLFGCASQPLTHDYKGDVNLQMITLDIQSLRDQESGTKGDLSVLTKIQKVFKAIEEVLDPVEREALMKQMKTFEQALVKSVRDASGVPLVVPGEPYIAFQYDDFQELVGIQFEYPAEEGAYMNLHGNIYYPSMSTTSFGVEVFSSEKIRVKPHLDLQIAGYNEKGKSFWSQTVGYTAKKQFVLSNDYVLGVATEDIENSKVFIIYLAEGIGKKIKKALKK